MSSDNLIAQLREANNQLQEENKQLKSVEQQAIRFFIAKKKQGGMQLTELSKLRVCILGNSNVHPKTL